MNYSPKNPEKAFLRKPKKHPLRESRSLGAHDVPDCISSSCISPFPLGLTPEGPQIAACKKRRKESRQ